MTSEAGSRCLHLPRLAGSALVALVLAALTACEAVEEYPEFPWPPPPASAELRIPSNWIPEPGESTRLYDVAEELERALRIARYRSWSFLSVPNGFALVSQMEQIGADGTPSPDEARWDTDMPSVRNMSLWGFIRALAGARPGYYRVIVFIVTDQPRSRDGARATGRDAESWLEEGEDRLPAGIGELSYDGQYRTDALVYEFRKRSQDGDAELVEPSATEGLDHLVKAGLLEPLSGVL